MKRSVLFLFATLGLLVCTYAQKQNLPKENSKVTREYDENGNLTRFDSVYSYSWSGDTTLLNSISPEKLEQLFGNQFGMFPDSSFMGKSFFDDFDQFFSLPFSGSQDSVQMKKFKNIPQFPDFMMGDDLLAKHFKDFEQFFNGFGENKSDSTSKPGSVQPNSMEEMIKMLQEQIKNMEEQHQKSLNKQPDWQEF